MEKRILEFIRENELSPFNSSKTYLNLNTNSIYKTRDAKGVHTKVLQKISRHFQFSDTSNLLHFFNFTTNLEEIKNRQNFFQRIKNLGKKENFFLNELKNPRSFWKPDYDVVVVTESPEIYNKLKEIGCPTQLLISETDVALLESRDIVQVLDCSEFGIALESLPQAVFLKSLDEAYLERHLEKFSGWIENINVLSNHPLSQSLTELITELLPLAELTNENDSKVLDRDLVEDRLEKINERVYEELKNQTISGESLVAMLNKGILPQNLKELIQNEIRKNELPVQIINVGIPASIDYEELDRLIQMQNSNEYSDKAERIKSYADKLKLIPEKLKELQDRLIFFDFITGVSQYIKEEMNFPVHSEEFQINNSKNIFLDNAHPITFNLNQNHKCSILTGANSGGKTTLIEHILQIISLSRLGFPISGQINLPVFEEVYYFAKNKGSMSKGAFETLLTQMSKIKPGNKTLILADEIEAVTEPGVAGKIISATSEYYINKNCYLVIATHLGHEIKHNLPQNARIDGIEAKGLNENFELIINHNPVLGRIANSTPELIVEKMSKTENTEYFNHLNNYLKRDFSGQ